MESNKLAIPIYLLSIFLLYCYGMFIHRHGYRKGFDEGQARVIGQMERSVSGQSNQWVEIVGGVYTNRFFTNWTLTVR